MSTLTQALSDAGFLLPLGMPGLYARSGGFEAVAAGLERFITASYPGETPERLRFPPVIDQRVLERNGYFVAFPHLAGCIHSFAGTTADHRRLLGKLLDQEPAGEEFVPTGCALTPAACYAAYPLIAARGPLAAAALLDVHCHCFRHEPSDDITRLQSFQMREYVCIGEPDQVVAFRDGWLRRAGEMMARLDLAGRIEVAHDPFFGTAGATLAAGQDEGGLKREMVIPVIRGAAPTACMSFNYHGAHFAAAWGLRMATGSLAHSACVGFGIERLVMALVAAHGPEVTSWPETVRHALRVVQ